MAIDPRRDTPTGEGLVKEAFQGIDLVSNTLDAIKTAGTLAAQERERVFREQEAQRRLELQQQELNQSTFFKQQDSAREDVKLGLQQAESELENEYRRRQIEQIKNNISWGLEKNRLEYQALNADNQYKQLQYTAKAQEISRDAADRDAFQRLVYGKDITSVDTNGFTARATGYYPVDPGDPAYQMEGGRVGAAEWHGQPVKQERLYTLEDFQEGKAPYVSVAMDNTLKNPLPYGSILSSPQFPGVPFRVMDTGSAFNGKTAKYGPAKGLTRIDIARRDAAGANSKINNQDIQFTVGAPAATSPDDQSAQIPVSQNEAATGNSTATSISAAPSFSGTASSPLPPSSSSSPATTSSPPSSPFTVAPQTPADRDYQRYLDLKRTYDNKILSGNLARKNPDLYEAGLVTMSKLEESPEVRRRIASTNLDAFLRIIPSSVLPYIEQNYGQTFQEIRNGDVPLEQVNDILKVVRQAASTYSRSVLAAQSSVSRRPVPAAGRNQTTPVNANRTAGSFLRSIGVGNSQ